MQTTQSHGACLAVSYDVARIVKDLDEATKTTRGRQGILLDGLAAVGEQCGEQLEREISDIEMLDCKKIEQSVQGLV
jgi:hypothetical protein